MKLDEGDFFMTVFPLAWGVPGLYAALTGDIDVLSRMIFLVVGVGGIGTSVLTVLDVKRRGAKPKRGGDGWKCGVSS